MDKQTYTPKDIQQAIHELERLELRRAEVWKHINTMLNNLKVQPITLTVPEGIDKQVAQRIVDEYGLGIQIH